MVRLETLAEYCEIEPDRRGAGAFELRFRVGLAVTTIRVVFDDAQSGAQMVITNMTTLPPGRRREGFGGRALGALLEWACLEGLTTVQAVQVQSEAEAFWTKNGFVKMGTVTNDFYYACA